MSSTEMDRTAAQLISDRITDLREMMTTRLDTQDEHLNRIEKLQKETNGRVTALEKARERAQGVIFAYAWVPNTLSAILGAGLTILVIALTGGIHT